MAATTYADLPVLVMQLDYDFPSPMAMPARCSIAVNPTVGWAIATQMKQIVDSTTSLLDALTTLAAQVCQDYDIKPANLMLLVRYTEPRGGRRTLEDDSYYLIQFDEANVDFFGCVGFTHAHATKLSFRQRDDMLAVLQQAQPLLPPSWLALAPDASINSIVSIE